MRADSAVYTAFDDYLCIDSAEPEKNLMRSILRSAMEDIQKHGEAGRIAREYFCNRDTNYLYSFRSICLHLNVSPQTILIKVGLLPAEEQLAA